MKIYYQSIHYRLQTAYDMLRHMYCWFFALTSINATHPGLKSSTLKEKGTTSHQFSWGLCSDDRGSWQIEDRHYVDLESCGHTWIGPNKPFHLDGSNGWMMSNASGTHKFTKITTWSLCMYSVGLNSNNQHASGVKPTSVMIDGADFAPGGLQWRGGPVANIMNMIKYDGKTRLYCWLRSREKWKACPRLI